MVVSWCSTSQARPSSECVRNFSRGARSSFSSNGSAGGCSARCRIIESKTGKSCRCTSTNLAWGELLTALLDEFGHQARPTGLVTRADSGAIVSLEIFIEQDQILPVRVVVENLSPACRRAPAILTAQKNAD